VTWPAVRGSARLIMTEKGKRNNNQPPSVIRSMSFTFVVDNIKSDLDPDSLRTDRDPDPAF
jgi:hypothetical protein